MQTIETIFETPLEFVCSSEFKRAIGADSPTIVDVGTGGGAEIEKFLSSFTSPKIFAIEAHPKIYNSLLNKFKREINTKSVLVAKAIVSNSDLPISALYVNRNDIQSGSIYKTRQHQVLSFNVPNAKLSQLNFIPPTIDLLWINTNFSELDVIKSAGKKLNSIKIIVCSTCIDSPKLDYFSTENLDQIKEFLIPTHSFAGFFKNHSNNNFGWSVFINNDIKLDEVLINYQTSFNSITQNFTKCAGAGAEIAVYPRYLISKRVSKTQFASDRIRADWICDNQNIELFANSCTNNYKAVIFHEICPEIDSFKGIKLFDVCDPIWEFGGIKNSKYIDAFSKCDAVLVPTLELKTMLESVVKTPVYVVKDRHKLQHYDSATSNLHLEPAKSVVWFGYSNNFECVYNLLNNISKFGLHLTIISDKLPNKIAKYLSSSEFTFVQFNIDTYIKHISSCDFAILPFNKEWKSDNKTVTAYLSGIPAAKTAEDIKLMINPEFRRLKIKEFDKSLYDVKLSTEEIISIVKNMKDDYSQLSIYTAITGKYDKSRPTNSIITVFGETEQDKFIQPVMNAKIYKVLAHKFFPASKYSMWIDGNIFPNFNAKYYISMLEDCDIAVFKHPYRSCIYDEAAPAAARVDSKYRDLVSTQIKEYRLDGMPAKYGLAECGVIIRKHTTLVEEFNLRWWAEICKYSQRDQISFPYVLWKMGSQIKVKFIDGNVRNHPAFKYVAR